MVRLMVASNRDYRKGMDELRRNKHGVLFSTDPDLEGKCILNLPKSLICHQKKCCCNLFTFLALSKQFFVSIFSDQLQCCSSVIFVFPIILGIFSIWSLD